MLETLKISKKTVGIKQTVKAVETGSAMVVFIAKDADERVIGKLRELCQTNIVEVVFAENMKLLGKACGVDVGAAAACTLK